MTIINTDTYLAESWEEDCRVKAYGGYREEEAEEVVCEECGAVNLKTERFCWRCRMCL